MQKVTRSRELSIKLGNAVGTGAALFGKLKGAKVNVVASCAYQIGGEAYFSIVPDDSARAEEILKDGGYTPAATDVLLVEMENQPGALADLLRRLAELGVSVTSAYVTTTGKRTALAVVKTDDDAKVLASLDPPAQPPQP